MVVTRAVHGDIELSVDRSKRGVAVMMTRNSPPSAVTNGGSFPVYLSVSFIGDKISLVRLQENGGGVDQRTIEQTPDTEIATRRFLSSDLNDLPSMLRAYTDLLRLVNEAEKPKDISISTEQEVSRHKALNSERGTVGSDRLAGGVKGGFLGLIASEVVASLVYMSSTGFHIAVIESYITSPLAVEVALAGVVIGGIIGAAVD